MLVLGGAGYALAWDFFSGSGEDGRFALRYEVTVADPESGVLDVRLVVSELSSRNLYLSFSSNGATSGPAAARYRIRSSTNANGDAVEVVPMDDAWRMRASGGELHIHYEAYLNSGRGHGEFTDEVLSHCDESGARLLGSDVFLFPAVGKADRIDVSYTLPENWELVHPFGTGESTARYPNIRSLYHSVVAAGEYRTLRRTTHGCELILAVRGSYEFDDRDLMEAITHLADIQMDFFEGPLRERYVFLVNPHPDSQDPHSLHYFGLHFDGSMILLIDSRTDRRRLHEEPAQLCAHEFYHNWNGEILRQVDYEMNWFVEGVTTFYAYQTRFEAGMLDFPRYAGALNERFHGDYASHPYYGRESLAAAGQRVLEDASTTRFLYSGGLFVAAALDVAIDDITVQQASLDDLMRDLVIRAQADPQWRLTRKSLEAELFAVTRRDFGPWLDRHVYGNEPPLLPSYITRELARR